MTTQERATVSRDFRRILKEQPEIGLANVMSAWFVEPAHIFDPSSRRKPKPAVVIVLSYILLMAVFCAIFNFM